MALFKNFKTLPHLYTFLPESHRQNFNSTGGCLTAMIPQIPLLTEIKYCIEVSLWQLVGSGLTVSLLPPVLRGRSGSCRLSASVATARVSYLGVRETAAYTNTLQYCRFNFNHGWGHLKHFISHIYFDSAGRCGVLSELEVKCLARGNVAMCRGGISNLRIPSDIPQPVWKRE